MPKELFHFLIADEYFKSGELAGRLSEIVGRERAGFLLGAISPDIFFYDVPTFRLGAFGERIHDLMDHDGIEFLAGWLRGVCGCAEEEGRDRPPGRGFDLTVAWGLGFASHFLADGLWHPVINGLSGSLDFCLWKGLGELNCHRFIESEMEAFWFPRMAPEEGAAIRGGQPLPSSAGNTRRREYLELLRGFASVKSRSAAQPELSGIPGLVSRIYLDFLGAAGLGPLPSPGAVRACFLSQNYLLRIFSSRVFGKYRDRLLEAGFGRYIGSLAVPDRPVLPSKGLYGVAADRNPFSDEFMENAITSLYVRLTDFAERLERSLPS